MFPVVGHFDRPLQSAPTMFQPFLRPCGKVTSMRGELPYGRCGRCHTNFARATPTFRPFIIIGHTNFDLLVNHIMFLATLTLETILRPW